MYGLIGKMRCVPGKRPDVVAAMSQGTSAMPGCRSYVVAEDPTDADVIWVTEVWETEAAHKASLELAEVKAAIAVARPLIDGFDLSARTTPVAIVQA